MLPVPLQTVVRIITRSILPVIMVVSAGAGFAGDDLAAAMLQRYERFSQAMEIEQNPLPFILESRSDASGSSASVRYLLEGVSFGVLAGHLSAPREWCEFIPLHLNIKACTWFTRGGASYLRFYAGVKEYATPDNAYLIELEFDTRRSDGVFSARLFAEDGPLDSTDLDFSIRAIGVNNSGRHGVYLEFDLSSVPGLAANLAKVYLATIGRSKIGFSTDGKTWTGKTKYVHGQRGATERNLVRYLLAIETYFNTLGIDDDDARYRKRLESWFFETERYAQQLHELDRNDYLRIKMQEKRNQQLLQQSLSAGSDLEFREIEERAR